MGRHGAPWLMAGVGMTGVPSEPRQMHDIFGATGQSASGVAVGAGAGGIWHCVPSGSHGPHVSGGMAVLSV